MFKTNNWLPHLNEVIRTTHRREQDWLRVNSKMKCPVCDKSDGCLIHAEEEKYICIRVPGDYTISKGLGGWLHDRTTTPDYFNHTDYVSKSIEEKKALYSKESRQYASDEDLNEFYSFVLSNFRLNSRHKEYLLSQGLKDLSDYGSLPYGGEYKCIEISSYFSEGIPGLFSSWNGKKKYLNLRAYGLYRAVRNIDGLIIGIEIRLDESCQKEMNSTAKYQPLTSARKTKGIQADGKRYGFIPGEDKTKLIITEGGKKGQIAQEKYNCDVIYLRGVGNWQKAVSDIQDSFPELKDIYIAFDSDKKTNIMVKQQHDNLIDALRDKYAFNIFTLEWDKSHKGIDDAINAGALIRKKEVFKGSKLFTLDEAAQVLRTSIEKVCVEQDGRTHVVRVTPGAGKTQTVINMINERLMNGDWFKTPEGKPARLLWLTENNYNLLAEAESQFIIAPARLEGRQADPSSLFHCSEMDLVMQAANQGHSVMHSVCFECPMFDECSYISRSKHIMDKELFVIGVKASFFNESDRLDKFDLIIIDESMTDVVYKTKEVSQADLASHKSQLDYLIYREQNPEKRQNMELSSMLLDLLNEQIIEWNQLSDQKGDIDPKNITDMVLDLKECFIEYESKPIEDSEGNKRYLKVFMEDLFRSVVHVHDGLIKVNAPQNKMIEHFKNKTIVNLDATPSTFKIKALEKCGMNEVVFHDIRVKEYVNVIQIMGLKGSKTQLLSEKYQNRFLETIKFIATKHNDSKTTVLAPKKFAEVLDEYQKQNDFHTMIGWFGNHTKGFNHFEGTDNIVIPGYYVKNISHMKMQLDTLSYMGAPGITLDQLIEEDTENELIQAVGRGRACRRESNPVNVFFITNRKIPSIYKVTQVSSMEAFMGVKEKDQQAGNKRVKAENDEKTRKAIELEIKNGVLIPELTVSYISDKYDLSRLAVERNMKTMWREQLLEACVNPEAFVDYVDSYANELKIPSQYECALFGIELTLLNPSVLYKISTHGLSMLIRQDQQIAEYLKQHPPVGTNPEKWSAAVEYMAESREGAVTFLDIAEGAGITRQIASKYVKQMIAIIEAKGVDWIKEHSNKPPTDPFEWDSLKFEGEEDMKTTLYGIAQWVTTPEIIEDHTAFDAIEQVMVKKEIYETDEFSEYIKTILKKYVSSVDNDEKYDRYTQMRDFYLLLLNEMKIQTEIRQLNG